MGPTPPPPFSSALRLSLLLAGAYGAFSIVYIIISTRLVERMATDIEQFARIEMYKGLVFVIGSTIMLFCLAFFALRGLSWKETILYSQREAINEAENRSAAGLFASSVAHDINNVLMITHHAVDMLSDMPLEEPVASRVVSIRHANAQLSELVKRLSEASGRHLTSGMKTFDIVQSVHSAIMLVKTHDQVRKCKIDLHLPDQLPVTVDALALHRMVLNLVINAADATGDGHHAGRIRVELQPSGDDVILAVHDNGPGIAPEDRQTVFEPFFSTKEAGTGLGLLSLHLFADMHHGKYGVRDSQLGGACFFVRFPRAVPNTPSEASG